MAGALSVQLQQAQVRLLVSLAVILAVAWVTLRGSLFRGPSQDETGVKYYQEDLGRGVNVAVSALQCDLSSLPAQLAGCLPPSIDLYPLPCISATHLPPTCCLL